VAYVEIEKQVQAHEERLKQHDKELGRLNDVTLEMQKSMNEGLARVDVSYVNKIPGKANKMQKFFVQFCKEMKSLMNASMN